MSEQNKTQNEIRIARKKDVWHLVKRGIITQLHFDFEAYGLNTNFAQIKEYGDVMGDISGNLIEKTEIEIRRPDRYVPSPQALVVTRSSINDLDDMSRYAHPAAMAKIAQRFEKAPLAAAIFGHAAKEDHVYTEFRKRGETLYPYPKKEEIVHIPLFEEGGRMDVDKAGNVFTDPPGILSLNEKGEILYGPEKKLVKIPKTLELEQPDGTFKETLVMRPMRPEDGRIVFDVRVHPARNRIAYRTVLDPKSPYYENTENQFYTDGDHGHEDAYAPSEVSQTRWKIRPPSLLVSGFRIKWYDISVLRANLVRAGFHPSNIFFTHSKSRISDTEMPKNIAVDGFTGAMNTHLFGPQGEDGLKIGKRDDQRSGEEVPSAKLELIMEENTRYGHKERGVREGVRMADGSIYDKRKGHKWPSYDSEASFQIYNHNRLIDPEIMKLTELQADEDYLREYVTGLDLTDPYPPIFAMMRNSYPNKPMADAMAFIGFDDREGQLRRGISIRLDGMDLRNYTYKGKSLIEMAREDLKNPNPATRNFVRMIKEHGRDPDSLIRVDSVRKFPGMVRIEKALHTESARNWDLEQIDRNYNFVAQEHHADIVAAIREAVEVMNWEMRQDQQIPNAMMEEEAVYNGFGDLDFLEYEAREEIVKKKRLPPKMQTTGVVQMLFEAATDVYRYHNHIDEQLHMIGVQPLPIDTLDLRTATEDDLREAVGNYWNIFKKSYDVLKKKDSPYVHIFDEFLENDENRLAPPGTKWGETSKTTGKRKRVSLYNMDHAELKAAYENIQSYRKWFKLERLADDEAERQDKRSAFKNGLFAHKYSKKGRVLFANLSRDFRVVDETGRELGIEYIKEEYADKPHVVQQKIEKGEWHLQFYRLRSEPSVTSILMQFSDNKELNELPAIWRFRYQALKLLYLNGPPNEDPSNMRWDALPVLEDQLLALEVNHTIDDGGSLARVFSHHVSGEAEVFLRSDEGQKWVADYRVALDKIKRGTKLTQDSMAAMHYDMKTGLPLDYIEHEIPAEKGEHYVIEVPDAHLADPLRDIRQSPYSLVIPALKEADRKAIRSGLPVVLKGMQSGALYYPGKVNITKAPKETPSYSDYFEQAQRAYEDESGIRFPTDGKRDVLRIQKLMPIAASRTVDAKHQTLKVPANFFKALTFPRGAYFNTDEPLTNLVMPAEYCPQELVAGEPIRLREMRTSMGAKIEGKEGLETGHNYETTLKDVKAITVGDLYDMVTTGQMSDDKARRYGYAGAYDMWEKINQAFLDRESPDIDRETLYMLSFEEVNKNSWVYFDPAKRPEAAFSRNGQPVSPSAYRTVVPAFGTDEISNDNDSHKPKGRTHKPS